MTAATDMGDRRVPARVIALVGARGAGRSTVALNVAAALAKRTLRVCVLDASHAQRERASLLEVAAGRARLSDALEAGAEGIDWLALTSAERRVPEGVSDASLLAHVDALEGRYDYVLIDAPALGQPRGAFFASAATDVVMIVTGEEQALRQSESLARMLAGRCGRPELLLVPNACGDAAEATAIGRTLGALASRPPHVRVRTIGWIPSDANIVRARRTHRSLISVAPEAAAARAAGALADRLVSLAPARPTGGAQFFFQSLIAQGRAA